MAGIKEQISTALKARIALVTTANGYSRDIKTINFDKVKLNITDFEDQDIPAVQIYDLTTVFKHENSRSETSWFLAIEICLRTKFNDGNVDQAALWTLEEDIKRAIFGDPKLGLRDPQAQGFSYVSTFLIDAKTDLHMLAPNYVATLGLEMRYHEPITRDNC